ncbi:phosphatidylcholine/phosphatidylserine synthase [Paracoccus sp. (in: a-proteobacteria)]|uniref:CDP-alcohol phosphatidyltransferase family protein n=1 Tax=Paracoccus sp. TaxID=267 RepID=UPI0026DF82B5|nr:CDP-alcohol phosphatidyltransferase family protein [Paracoccus sp. (in: a-proteobacteria)]MDO5370012.1 phosphatidylcholine synthase [Paracoccus sp. (in: a-proteobacteria)]
MILRLKAFSVHLLTATGAIWAILAMLAAADGKWSAMFVWLVVAMVVDGVDGPLARRYGVKANWPTHDGVVMDLMVDYLTWIFIPAFALFQSGLLPGWTGWVCTIAIVYGSILYMADTRMKTRDNSFAGFPACWNMVVLVLFALKPSYWVILAVVILLTAAMFIPVKFIHPVRTARWRAVSLPMMAAWVVFAIWAIAVGFHPQSWALWGLVVSSVWLLLAGPLQQVIPPRKRLRA